MRIKIVFVILFCSTSIGAQTYNHDGAVMRQYTVAEEGIGSLSPDLYYEWFHRDYSSWAKKENKLAARWWMYNSIHQELGYAEQIDSSLTRRAKIEAIKPIRRMLSSQLLPVGRSPW